MENYIEIIDFAITYEEFSIALYSHLALLSENDWLKERFIQLASKESEHKNKLINLKDTKRFIITDDYYTKIEKIVNKFNIIAYEELSYKDSLFLAMQNEKNLFKLYLVLSEAVSDKEVINTFSLMAQDEAQHKLFFELEYEMNFEHPFIEIDNSKCNLCADCVKVCSNIVGADALKLVEYGVTPSTGNKLQDTLCESCGLCIAVCPTQAISERAVIKSDMDEFDSFETICNYCSVGCTIKVHTNENGEAIKVSGVEGTVNTDGNICKYARFGYQYMNNTKRITKPLLKVDGVFEEISFKEAYDLIVAKIKEVKPDENAFFAGARLTNEEIYLVQKLARAGAKTNNILSLHYIKRGAHIINTSFDNVPFEEISGASKIFLIGSELNEEHPVVSYMVYDTKYKKHIEIDSVTTLAETSMKSKCNNIIKIDSYYHFIKAVNHYIVTNKLYNMMFIKDNCDNFDLYCKTLIAEDYTELVKLSGTTADIISMFAEDYNLQMNAIILFTEKEISAPASTELYNLTMLTGKLGKTSNGLIALKTKNNSQGVFDMGAYPTFGVGYQEINDADFINKLEKTWKIKGLPKHSIREQEVLLREGKIKNIFVFGEDPLGCSIDKDYIKEVGAKLDFGVVQDYYMTETAKQANLVLPASLPFEIGGHFTNTQRYIQKVTKTMPSPVSDNSYQQLYYLLKKFGVDSTIDPDQIMFEAISLLPDVDEDYERSKYKFVNTEDNNYIRLFDYGCDNLTMYFDKYFENKFKN